MAVLLNFLIIQVIIISSINANDGKNFNSALDHNLYEEVLNPIECKNQLEYIVTNDNSLRAEFMDASMRTPRGILLTNYRDMGNYFQCLELSKEVENMVVEGKYCIVEVPLTKDLDVASLQGIGPEFPWYDHQWNNDYSQSRTIDRQTYEDVIHFEQGKESISEIFGSRKVSMREPQNDTTATIDIQLELAICIPKVCSTQQALNFLTKNSSLSYDFNEAFCRLPNDKPWVAADYVAIVIFSLIGLLTILSTLYDVRHSIILKKDPKLANKVFISFSAYTNTRKVFTFKSDPKALNCVEGVRSLAMLWVVVIHTFATQFSLPANPIDVYEFMTSFWSLWITSGAITVDTFFMLSGLLLVYTQASKMSRMAFLKNLHMFYLNRLLRMFPMLATGILLQASFQNHVTDGPYWGIVAKSTDDCRQYWWTTLLYVHNLVGYGYLCLGHTWYLAVDMQLYVISPIVLVWVLGGNQKSAWASLIGSLIAILAGSTVYNFLMEFKSSALAISRPEDTGFYFQYYYIHTFPRASPFFVGMVFGYLLHLGRGRKIKMSKVLVTVLWILATVTLSTVIISNYFIIQPDWDNQTVDSLLNSFMRPAWAACVAWLIFACVHGYGGPINWFLSLNVFKFLGRLSYAMYILHLPIIYITNATALTPIYFSVQFCMYKLMVDLNFTIIASLLATVFIDLPFSGLFAMLLGGMKRKEVDPKKDDSRNDAATDTDDPPKPSLSPINWFLSLNVFKFLGRLSYYAKYILHLPIIYITNATALTPIYFAVQFSMYKLMVDLNFTIIASLLATVFKDLPFSGLFAMLLGGIKRKVVNPKKNNSRNKAATDTKDPPKPSLSNRTLQLTKK